MNSLSIVGNLTKDPELRYTPSGKPVCQLRVAVSGIGDATPLYLDIGLPMPNLRGWADWTNSHSGILGLEKMWASHYDEAIERFAEYRLKPVWATYELPPTMVEAGARPWIITPAEARIAPSSPAPAAARPPAFGNGSAGATGSPGDGEPPGDDRHEPEAPMAMGP